MLQRKLDSEDPASGKIEFPGGGIEDGENALAGAEREFTEETGLPVPDGQMRDNWISDNGVYQCFILDVPVEASAFSELNPDLAAAEGINPDDPSRTSPEVTIWLAPEHVANMGDAIRQEVLDQTPWDLFGEDAMTAAITAAAPQKGVNPFAKTPAPTSAPGTPPGKPDADGEFSNKILDLCGTYLAQSGPDSDPDLVKIAQHVESVIGDETTAVTAAVVPADATPADPEDKKELSLIDQIVQLLYAPNQDTQKLISLVEQLKNTITSEPADAPAITASVTGDTSMPVVGRDVHWEGNKSTTRVLDHFTDSTGKLDVAGAEKAFLWHDPNVAPDARGGFILGFADIIDGELKIVPRAVAACASGHGVTAVKGLSADDVKAVKNKICDLYTTVRGTIPDWPDCPFGPEGVTAASAGMLDQPAPVAPPGEWFEGFDLGGKTPLTVTPDGRVYGHIATWDSCHADFPGVCVPPPRDPEAPFFHLGSVITAEGDEIPVGRLTVGGGHATTDKGLKAALEHYDSTSTCGAIVRAVEDQWGIGLFGATVAEATPEQVAAIRRSPLSGDWRKVGGRYRFAAAHAVNSPAYPVLRQGLAASIAASDEAFVVTGRVDRDNSVDFSSAARRLARSVGLDHDSRRAKLAAKMSGGQ